MAGIKMASCLLLGEVLPAGVKTLFTQSTSYKKMISEKLVVQTFWKLDSEFIIICIAVLKAARYGVQLNCLLLIVNAYFRN